MLATLVLAPVLATMVLAPMLETHASGTVLRAISSVCYGTSYMSIRHNSRALAKN